MCLSGFYNRQSISLDGGGGGTSWRQEVGTPGVIAPFASLSQNNSIIVYLKLREGILGDIGTLIRINVCFGLEEADERNQRKGECTRGESSPGGAASKHLV